MRGNWASDVVPEGRAEWIGFSIALVVVLSGGLVDIPVNFG